MWNQHTFFLKTCFPISTCRDSSSYLTLRDMFTKPQCKQNNSNSQALKRKLWQKSQCLYHMQTQAATAASSCMIYVPFSVLLHGPWSPRKQLAEAFDWLSGRFHELCFTSFYSCLNDLVSLWVMWLLCQCPHRNKPVARKETVIFVQNKKPGIILME